MSSSPHPSNLKPPLSLYLPLSLKYKESRNMHHKNIKPKVKYTHKRLIRPKMPKQSTKITLSVSCVGLYCWRGTCPEVWLINPVRLQWGKKKKPDFFPIQVNISSCPHPPLGVGTSSALILYRPRASHQSEFTCPSVLLYLEESPSLCLLPSLQLLVCLEDSVLQKSRSEHCPVWVSVWCHVQSSS